MNTYCVPLNMLLLFHRYSFTIIYNIFTNYYRIYLTTLVLAYSLDNGN